MKKISILTLLVFFVLVIPFTACQNGSSRLGHFLDEYYVGVNVLDDITFEPEPDGIVQVTSYRVGSGMDKPAMYSCGGSMYTQNGRKKTTVNGGQMVIGNIELDADNKRNNLYGFDGDCRCEHLFGKQVDFKLSGVPNPSYHNSGFVDNLYVPKEIYILYPAENQKIKSNEELAIKWNPDESNTEDVMILSIRVVSTSNVIDEIGTLEKRFVIEDSGEYILTKEDLKNIGTDSKLAIKLIRGNYNVVVSDDFSTYSICGFAYAEGIYDMM